MPRRSNLNPCARAAAQPALGLIALALAACTSATSPGGPSGPVTPTTYQGAARAVLEQSCTGCHTPGGIAPFALDSYAAAKAMAPLVVAAVENGQMPPWMPDPACRHYRHERVMSPAAKSVLRAWLESGSPEGEISEYVAPATGDPSLGDDGAPVGPPSMVLKPTEAYAPDRTKTDDYRCFPLPQEFTEEAYLYAGTVIPGLKELVHHVIVFLVQPGFGPALADLDGKEAGAGYTCFGGPGVGAPQTVAGWVPGAVPLAVTNGAAIRIPAGGRLVMQVHYNTINPATGTDLTQLQLWFRATRPDYLLTVRPLPHIGLEIPANESASKQVRTFKNTSGRDWLVAGALSHMHLLGTKQRITAVHADGREECMIDIPRWDFHWQQAYGFLPGEEVVVKNGESVRLECTYDNSAANQQVVGGKQLESSKVLWGEGTLDEMCLGYLFVVDPYTPVKSSADQCPGFQGCYDACRANLPMTACALQCSKDVGPDCSQCVLQGLFPCVLHDCVESAGPLSQCLQDCQDGTDPETCTRTLCTGNIFSFDRCAGPIVSAGSCDVAVSSCGVHL